MWEELPVATSAAPLKYSFLTHFHYLVIMQPTSLSVALAILIPVHKLG